MNTSANDRTPIELFGVPIDSTEPSLLVMPPSWTGHVPFAFWLVAAARPRVIVELGTHTGTSYCAMCEAVQRNGVEAECYAVDTWRGDEHAGFYAGSVLDELRAHHDPRYGTFSTLLQTTFDEAVERFAPGTIDLLHIDGLHTYDAVRHDFETWRDRLGERAVVLFHDTAVKDGSFGVWKYWEELCEQFPSFSFLHSNGLGVLAVGRDLPPPVRMLTERDADPSQIRDLFSALGDRWSRKLITDEAPEIIAAKDVRIGTLTAENEYLSRSAKQREEENERLRLELQEVRATAERDAEEARKRAEEARERHARTQREAEEDRALLLERVDTVQAAADRRFRALTSSYSWRITAPGRVVGRGVERLECLGRRAIGLILDRWYRVPSPTPLFDKTYYKRNQPDLVRPPVDPWLHYHLHGAYEGRDPNPLFDSAWYLHNNPDVRRARKNPLVHYWKQGAREGRDPHPYFSTSWYLQNNPDVAASGTNPLLHYLHNGGVEGRSPHPRFDAVAYLAANPDVAESKANPLIHFLRYGRYEGRRAAPVNSEFGYLLDKAKEYAPSFRNDNYQAWIEAVETRPDAERPRLLALLDGMTYRPTFSVIMPVYNSDLRFLEKAIDSVRRQIYPSWELCICDDASTLPQIRPFLEQQAARDGRIKPTFRDKNGHIAEASNSAIATATGEFVCFLDHDDEIPEHALLMVADELNRHPDANLVYTDQDKIDVEGVRTDPYFKPDLNLDLLRSQNYIDHLATFRTSLVRDLGGLRRGYEGSQDYDLVLRAVDASRPEQIRHVPHVLYHWRAVPGSIAFAPGEKNYAPERSRAALRDHLARNRVDAQVLAPYPEYSVHRVKYALPDEKPLVSIIVPTRDQVEMLRRCVDSILVETDYDPIELIIVDNGSEESETLAYLEAIGKDERVRVIDYDLPFNYSAINNKAVAESRGELVCFLNNDVYAINADWLEEMVRHACRPEIGAVGARLLYPTGHIQHSGVVAGYRGLAGHAFRYMRRDDLGPWAQPRLIQNFLAVTAACMVMRRNVFLEVGGFNEVDLRVVFNDVDLCYRVHEAGYRNLFTPYAELFHVESVTRKTLAYESENEYLREHWGKWIEHDPYFNKNLDRNHESYILPTAK